MSDWWAKKLGGGTPQPTSHPPMGHQPIVGYRQPPPGQQQQQQPYPQQAPAQIPPPPQGVDPNIWAQQWSAGGTMSQRLLQDPAHVPDQAKGTLTETGFCPLCGSGNFFSRTNGTTIAGGLLYGKPPAPHCYDCGYPVEQSGSPGGPATSAKVVGPAREAAQPAHYAQQLGGG